MEVGDDPWHTTALSDLFEATRDVGGSPHFRCAVLNNFRRIENGGKKNMFSGRLKLL